MGATRIIILFALLFAVSGFSGLIYESIWSHYLKLFLGHAAYAQTLVLAIFMGGMAIGSWSAGFLAPRWKNLLIAYAVVEAVIGLFALVFHEAYDSFLQLAYSSILPSIDSAGAVQFFKWASASLLIFPQSVLLGMTFPLMTAGIIRCLPEHKGRIVSTFYFSNSIGASIGVLVSGFLFIDWFGLPGTIKTAGLINILVATMVVLLVKKYDVKTEDPAADLKKPHETSTAKTDSQVVFFLALAFATGLASFIYEVSWIRMLSLVLGSSTHAFEMMLSAFIFGLALGSFWLRHRIDRLKNEVKFLAYVQLLMGFFALLTLPFYSFVFDAMQWVVSNVEKTDQGYNLFNISSHLLALAVMLPTTFCAGLTLPLITHILLGSGYGERSIGNVYAVNTVGAIVGVVITIHLLLPGLGLKNTVVIGAAIDIAIGILILVGLMRRSKSVAGSKNIAPAVAAVLSLLVMVSLVEFDSYKMASGVYRHGNFYTAENAELLFHQDGKTASIDLVRVKANNEISIITNGKPDASINVDVNGVPSPDEATMVLAAALPLSIKPDSREAAVIGLGSGLTSHALVSSNMLQQVDTIEIEPAIVEAAKGFQPRVSSVYNSPVSKIYIDDAKSYFSTRNKQYDLIVSEPSNPWVSGVASLFTEEFYGLVKRYLNEGGVFAQWLQLYEIDMSLVASVLKAITRQFDDYVIYAANNNDVIIMARNNKPIGSPSERIFRSPVLAQELARVRVRNIQDLQLRMIGNKTYLDPLIQSYDIPLNSDYYPVLDLKAIKARFLQHDAMKIITLVDDPVKSQSLLSRQQLPLLQTQVTPSRFYYPADLAYAAMIVREFLLNGRIDRQFPRLPEQMRRNVLGLNALMTDCNVLPDEGAVLTALDYVTSAISPFLVNAELSAIWQKLKTSSCASQYSNNIKQRIDLNIAMADSNLAEASRLSKELLAGNAVAKEQILFAGMTASLALGDRQQAKSLWETYGATIQIEEKSELLLRLLKAHAGINHQ
jgi:predicted membrane-bound spermidine synthase